MARVLQVCNSDFYLDKFLAPLVLELAARGHSVECVCEGSAIGPCLSAAGIVTHELEFPKKGSPGVFVATIWRMRALLRRGKYDCVDSHNRNASIVGRIAAWLEGTPINLYTAHGFYFHDDQSLAARQLSLWAEKVLAKVTDFTFSQSREDVEFVSGIGRINALFDRIGKY